MVPLEEFINALIQMYNMGAEYVDLVITPGRLQDRIGIIAKEEYMVDPKEHQEKELTDEDIDELLKN